MSEWKKIGNVSDIPPGTVKAFTTFERSIAVYNLEGEFFACENDCPHRGGPLSEGKLEGHMISCPWHNWKFNVKTGSFQADDSICLQRFPVKEENSELFIQLTPI